MKTSRAAVQTIFATLTNGIASVVVNSNKTTVQLSIDTNKTITSLIQSALTELLKVKNATVKAELADVQKAVNGAQALFKSFSDSLVGFRNGFWNAFSNTMSQALSDLQSTLDSFTDAAAMMIDNDNLKVAKVAGCKLTSFKLFDDLLKNATNEAAVCLKNYTAADVAFNTRVALSFKTIASIASLPLGNATLCLTINQLKTADAIDKASDCNRMSLVSCMDLVGILLILICTQNYIFIISEHHLSWGLRICFWRCDCIVPGLLWRKLCIHCGLHLV